MKKPNLMRVAPELPVRDVTESLEHYKKKLGFEVVMMLSDGEYAIVERDDVALHLFRNASGAHSPGSLHVFASGLDDLFHEFQQRGAELIQTIVRQPWGNRDFRVIDPSGNTIKFTEPLGRGE